MATAPFITDQEISNKVIETLKNFPTDYKAMKKSISSYVGHFTREIKTIEAEIRAISETTYKTKNQIERLNHAFSQIKIRIKIIEEAYAIADKSAPSEMDSDTLHNQLEHEIDRYEEIDRRVYYFLDQIKAEMENHTKDKKSDSTFTTNQSDNRPILRASETLKPKVLDPSFTPKMLENWISGIGDYFQQAGIIKENLAYQKSYAKTFISENIWTNIISHLNPRAPVINFDGNNQVIINRNDEEIEDWSLLDFVDQEFRRIYPIITRRLELFEYRPKNKNTIQVISDFTKSCQTADIDNITPDQLKIVLLISYIENEETRKEVLKEYHAGNIKHVNDITPIVRSIEFAERSSDFISKKPQNQVYLTRYQRQKRNFNKRSDSHGRGRSSSRGRGGFRGRGRGNGRGGRGVRGRFSSNVGQNRQQSPSPQRKSDSAKFCHFHHSTSHSDAQCKAQKSGGHKSRSMSRNRRDGQKSPSYSPSPSSRANYCHLVNDQIVGLKGGKQTPRVSFQFEFMKNGQKKKFVHKSICDTGTSRTLCSLGFARKHGLNLKPAIGETLKNASGKKMEINGKTTFTLSLPKWTKKSVLVDALVSSDLSSDIVLVAWHDLENLDIIHFSEIVDNTNEAYKTSTEIDSTSSKIENTSTEIDSTETHKKPKSTKIMDENMDLEEAKNMFLAEFPEVLSNELSSTPIKCDPVSIKIDKKKLKKHKIRRCLVARQYPVNMEAECKAELEHLKKSGVIRKMLPNETSDFLHPGFFVLKNDEKRSPRLITDMTDLNCVAERKVHPIPSTNEILKKLKPNTKFMAKIDFLRGFNQIPVRIQDQAKLQFILPSGRWTYTRLPLGYSSAGDSFAEISDKIMESLNFGDKYLKLCDDVILLAERKEELFDMVRRLLEKCKSMNIILSKRKFDISTKLTFLGHEIEGDTVRASPDKIRAIRDFSTPQTISQLRSYMGLANTFAKFHPDLSMILEKLRELLKKDRVFKMTEELIQIFEQSKHMITSTPILQAFRKDRKTVLVQDSSLSGNGYLLYQIDPDIPDKLYLIQCGSRALTDTQKRWAIHENELDSIRWSLKCCSYYVRGLTKENFTVFSDCRSVLGVMRKPLAEIKSPRLLRTRLDIEQFDFELSFLRSIKNQASDCLSRRILWSGFESKPDDEPTTEEFLTNNISLLVTHMSESPKYLENIQKAAEEDIGYKQIIEAVEKKLSLQDLPESHPAHAYRNVWHDLSTENGLLICDSTRICIPTRQLQLECARSLHNRGHIGLSRCRRLAKTFWMWPTLNSDLKALVQSCILCQTYQRSNPTQKVHPEFSNSDDIFPMSHLCMDIFHYENANYLTLVDRYSNYSWCFKLKSMTSTAILKKLKPLFLEHGLPLFLSQDNAKNLNSAEMDEFLNKNGIASINSSPYFSRSSGLAEKFCGIHKNLLKKSTSFDDFLAQLQALRNCPKSDESFTPAQLFYGRRQRTANLPMLKVHLSEGSNSEIYQDRIERRSKYYKTRKPGKVLKKFEIGSVVRIMDPIKKVWTTTGVIQEEIKRKICPKENCMECKDVSKSYSILIGGRKKIVRNQKFLKLHHEIITKELKNAVKFDKVSASQHAADSASQHRGQDSPHALNSIMKKPFQANFQPRRSARLQQKISFTECPPK